MNASFDVRIGETRTTIDGTPILTAEPVAWFHAILGSPSRVVPAGPTAPAGHRNNHIHIYDDLGMTLNEHHYTYQIQEVDIVLDTTDAIHSTPRPFAGRLEIGGAQIVAGAFEDILKSSDIRFSALHQGKWFAKVKSAPGSGREIPVFVHTAGRKLPSGRRSKIRLVVTVAICLEHDPWDARFRP